MSLTDPKLKKYTIKNQALMLQIHEHQADLESGR